MKTFLLAFSCLFSLSSAQFDSICAGANGNSKCCVNSQNDPSQDSEYMFMPSDNAANQLLFCNINGGRLAYIETIAENDCLNQYIQEGKLLNIIWALSSIGILTMFKLARLREQN